MQSIDYLPLLPRELSRTIFATLSGNWESHLFNVELVSKSWADVVHEYYAFAANKGTSLLHLGFSIKRAIAFVKQKDLTCASFTYYSSAIGHFIPEISLLSNLQKFRANCIDQQMLEHFGKLKNLRQLILDCGGITSLEPISSLIYLEKLKFSAWRGPYFKADSISTLSKLQKLTLSHFRSDFWPFGRLTNLRSLKLSHCFHRGKVQVNALTLLKRLSLRNCKIASDDLDVEQICQMSNLQLLDLSGGVYTDADLMHITSLVQLRVLKLERSPLLTDVTLKHIGKLIDLQKLSLTECPSITSFGIEYVGNLTAMQELNLSQCNQLDDLVGEIICKLTGLEFLNLSGSQLSDRGLAHFETLSRLQRLYLFDCNKISKSHVNELPSIS